MRNFSLARPAGAARPFRSQLAAQRERLAIDVLANGYVVLTDDHAPVPYSS
jgi:hypothetical protein